jgi:hypothetical protein
VLIDLENGSLPLALVRELRPRLEPFFADDVLGTKVLELRRICTSCGRKVNQRDGSLEVTVMVCRDIRDEISGVRIANYASADFECGHCLL